MKQFVISAMKFVLTAIIVTVIVGSIAVRSIASLANENYELRQQITQLQESAKEPQTMDCNLHIRLLPSWDIKFLTYKIRMEFPTTRDFYETYTSGDLIPILQFEDNYFLSVYITAQ